MYMRKGFGLGGGEPVNEKTYYELAKEMETTAWQFLADNGVEVYFPTDDEKAEWAAYGASLYEKLGQELGCEELVKEVVQIADEYKAAHAK